MEPQTTFEHTVKAEFRNRISAIQSACVAGSLPEFQSSISTAQDYFDLYRSQWGPWTNDFLAIHHVAVFVIGFWDWRNSFGDSVSIQDNSTLITEGAPLIDPKGLLARSPASCAAYVGAGLSKINRQSQTLLKKME